MSDLAIVIPAYKEIYFDKTLNSLAQQTNKNFTVYIGDDCSPYALQNIVDKYKEQLNIHYTRFGDNIGSRNLVLQWKRCMALTKQEKWLCLFSDDDLMDENCVENFHLTVSLKENMFDVYRFNTITINQHGEIINRGIIGPAIESSAQMAYHLLKGERGNSMPDHVFSRKIYTDCGGFVFTEYAQGADWATSILFSKEKGICIIPNAKVYWRYSGINISSTAATNKDRMINGHLQFISWALNHFEYLKTAASNITYDMMIDALRINLKMVMLYHYKGFNYGQALELLNFHHNELKLSYRNSFKELMEINRLQLPTIHRLKQIIVKIKNKLS
jgi:glycosyltransferase involved in cell wall biosynthesis